MFFFYENDYNEPYNPADIRIESKSFPVFQVMHWIDNDELELQPEYQRNKVWDRRAKSLLIESLILRIPIPAFYFSEDINGAKSIIDGLQRITALHDYILGKYSLFGLQYLRDCEGRYFAELSGKYRHRIEDTQLTINILDSSCPRLVKYDVFHRINTQGTPLNKQEIRNILMSRSTRNLIVHMATMDIFLDVTHRMVRDTRMEAQELCLRYLACYLGIDKNSLIYSKFSDLSDLVDLVVNELNNMSDTDKSGLCEIFEKSMYMCWKVFGEYAFMKNGKQRRRFNKAQFVSFSVIFSIRHYDLKKFRNCIDMQQKLDAFIEKNSEYNAALKSATSSYNHVQAQVLFADQFLRENL